MTTSLYTCKYIHTCQRMQPCKPKHTIYGYSRHEACRHCDREICTPLLFLCTQAHTETQTLGVGKSYAPVVAIAVTNCAEGNCDGSLQLYASVSREAYSMQVNYGLKRFLCLCHREVNLITLHFVPCTHWPPLGDITHATFIYRLSNSMHCYIY